MYLPWVLVAFNVLMGGRYAMTVTLHHIIHAHGQLSLLFSGFSELIGIVVGHAYFFLRYKYPQEFGGASYLETPNFM